MAIYSVQGQANEVYRPKLAIKFNAFALFAYTSGIEIGAESAVSRNSTIHFGGSYLSDFGIFENKDFNGYKLIGEYRIYRLFRSSNDRNTYTSFQLHLKQAFVEGSTFVDRANGSYQQLYDIKVVNTSLDFLLANGIILVVTPKFNIDLSVLYGAKRLSLASDNLPEDAVFNLFDRNIFDFTLNEVGSQWFPVLRFQLKFNFVIR
ncbi:MAG: hypothetical protein AAGG68_20345 [Bacteroidota bacterium]